MNADDMRKLLQRSLTEGGMDDDGASPDRSAIAGRVRGARRRRAALTAAGGVASVALVAAVVWQASAIDRDPMPPATSTQTSPSTDPTEDPSGSATSEEPTGTPSDDPVTDPADWSEAVFPECGDTGFALPERTSQLVVDGGPPDALQPGAVWRTTLRNTGTTGISGDVAILQTVVVDDAGEVVATIDPDNEVFWGAEGSVSLSIDAGAELPFIVQPTWGCDGAVLPAGEYTVYVLITVAEALGAEHATMEQAQGGPFPLVVDDGAPDSAPELEPPAGAVPFTGACGDTWAAPDVQTGYELQLLDDIRPERAADDDIDGTARLTTTSDLTGTVYHEVLVLAGGEVVSEAPGTDAAPEVYLSGGASFESGFGTQFIGCDSQPLPSGDYEVVVVTVLMTGGERYAIALTEPLAVVLQ